MLLDEKKTFEDEVGVDLALLHKLPILSETLHLTKTLLNRARIFLAWKDFRSIFIISHLSSYQ